MAEEIKYGGVNSLQQLITLIPARFASPDRLSISGVRIPYTWGNKAEGLYSVTIGMGNASSVCAINIGDGEASGGYAINIGTGNVASGGESITIGYNVHATAPSQIAVGMYNEERSEENSNSFAKYPFIVGIGTSDDDRKNALVIDDGGNAIFSGDVTATVDGEEVTISTLLAEINNLKTIINEITTKVDGLSEDEIDEIFG